MHNEIKTEILINSSSQRVYEILTNLFDYEKWNPFIIKSEGIVGVGNRIKNTMKNGNKSIVFKPKIVKADKEKEFAWLGHLVSKEFSMVTIIFKSKQLKKVKYFLFTVKYSPEYLQDLF